jgi:hypothetical protein
MRRTTKWGHTILGMMVMLIISNTIIPVYAALDARQITAHFGIKLIINGEEASIAGHDGRPVEPFIYNGRTFFPLAAVAEALRLPTEWDATANTAYIGVRPDKVYRLSDLTDLPHPRWHNQLRHDQEMRDNYDTFRRDVTFVSTWSTFRESAFMDYDVNLDKLFSRMEGVFFLSHSTKDTVNETVLKFYGDGRLLYESGPITAGSIPINFNVDVSGVETLKVAFDMDVWGDLTVGISDVTLHP